MNKKILFTHILISVLIVVIETYRTIYIVGFFGSIFQVLLKKIGILITIYWLGVLSIIYMKNKMK